MRTEFYLHNDYESSEIRENLDGEVEGEVAETLVQELYSFFYEVGFDVEYDSTGKITSVRMKKTI